MLDEPTPTTIGELAIAMNLQFQGVREQLKKVDELPGKVVVLEYRLAELEKSAMDRRALWIAILGWVVAIAAGVVGVLN